MREFEMLKKRELALHSGYSILAERVGEMIKKATILELWSLILLQIQDEAPHLRA